MSIRSNRSRIGNCLLLLVLLVGILVLVGLIFPSYITARAYKQFGSPSPGLNAVQRLYLSTMVVLQSNHLTQPAQPGGKEVKLTIDQGESVPSIIGKFWEAGLISSPGAFRSYLQYTGLDTTLQAGEYKLNPAMTPIEIAAAIQSSVSPEVTWTILPGWRLEEIANSLTTSGLTITPQEFLYAAQGPHEGYSFSSCSSSLEGYIYPGSYTLSRQTSLQDLLPQLLMNFEAHLTQELKDGFTTQGLDLCQAVTMASIVQREAVQADEMPLIASVFYNRLAVGSVLASDPTVQYALGYNQVQATWWTNPLSLQDLQIDSPYNTYIYAGLPPGPISNLGVTALRAVAFPAQTPYYYFRSACDGSGRHTFSQTYEEHVGNACP